MAERQAIHAYTSDEAHKAWQQFAEENGVSVTGLVERLGLTLEERIAAVGCADDPAAMGDFWRELVRGARRIDADRRRRGVAG